MTNLSELQRLSDHELVALVATEVMGWRHVIVPNWREGGETHEHFVIPGKKGYTKTWDPLTDWDHTMEVVEKMRAMGFHVEISDGNSSDDGNDEWCCWFHNEELPFRQSVWNDNAPSAIVLAALLAVSKS